MRYLFLCLFLMLSVKANYVITEQEMNIIKNKLIKLKEIEDATPELRFDSYIQIRTWDNKFYSPNFLTGTLELGSLQYKVKYPFQHRIEYIEKTEIISYNLKFKYGFFKENQVILLEPIHYKDVKANLTVGKWFLGVTFSINILKHLEGHIGWFKDDFQYGLSFDLLDF